MIELIDTTGETHFFNPKNLYEVGPFKPMMPTQVKSKTKSIIVSGSWKVRLHNGERFISLGTIKQYDMIVKVLIIKYLENRADLILLKRRPKKKKILETISEEV